MMMKKSIELSLLWTCEPWISRRSRYPETIEANRLDILYQMIFYLLQSTKFHDNTIRRSIIYQTHCIINQSLIFPKLYSTVIAWNWKAILQTAIINSHTSICSSVIAIQTVNPVYLFCSISNYDVNPEGHNQNNATNSNVGLYD